MWVRVISDVDLQQWSQLAAAEGVRFETADRFFFDGQTAPYARGAKRRHRTNVA
jgi:hypothetical protein